MLKSRINALELFAASLVSTGSIQSGIPGFYNWEK